MNFEKIYKQSLQETLVAPSEPEGIYRNDHWPHRAKFGSGQKVKTPDGKIGKIMRIHNKTGRGRTTQISYYVGFPYDEEELIEYKGSND